MHAGSDPCSIRILSHRLDDSKHVPFALGRWSCFSLNYLSHGARLKLEMKSTKCYEQYSVPAILASLCILSHVLCMFHLSLVALHRMSVNEPSWAILDPCLCMCHYSAASSICICTCIFANYSVLFSLGCATVFRTAGTQLCISVDQISTTHCDPGRIFVTAKVPRRKWHVYCPAHNSPPFRGYPLPRPHRPASSSPE